MKTLHIAETTAHILAARWKLNEDEYNAILVFAGGSRLPIFVRANKHGQVNWGRTAQYCYRELVERNNVKFVKLVEQEFAMNHELTTMHRARPSGKQKRKHCKLKIA